MWGCPQLNSVHAPPDLRGFISLDPRLRVVGAGVAWAPRLSAVRAGLRGGCWIFFGKITRCAQTFFSGKKSNNHPAPTGTGGFTDQKTLGAKHHCILPFLRCLQTRTIVGLPSPVSRISYFVFCLLLPVLALTLNPPVFNLAFSFVFNLPIPPLPVGRGVWGVFLAGKKMSERSELFFPEEKHPAPRVPARTPGRLGAQAQS